MTRFTQIIKDTSRNIGRYPGTALGSLLSLTFLFLLFDLFWISSGTFDNWYDGLLNEMQMEVFADASIEEIDIPSLQQKLGEIEGVSDISYISKEKAREILTDMLGTDLLIGYDTINPLPRSFVLGFDGNSVSSENLAAVAAEAKRLSGILEVSYARQWLVKLEQTRSIITNVGMALGLFILLTALISSVNNMRLMTRARAVGFRQMRLLGASRFYLAVPFLIEGCLIGGMAGAIGWAVVLYGRMQISLTSIEIIYPRYEEILIFCATTAFLGAISGYLGIRRLTR